MKTLFLILVTIQTISACDRVKNEELRSINIVIDKLSAKQDFGSLRLLQSLRSVGYSPILIDRKDVKGSEDIQVHVVANDTLIEKEGYSLAHSESGIEVGSHDESGAMIQIESNSHSNEKNLEGDTIAFSRGRWKSITFICTRSKRRFLRNRGRALQAEL
ncbi:MAG: hypothetical protein JXQ96_18310 [Cyclobacteriaceae bacterium]